MSLRTGNGMKILKNSLLLPPAKALLLLLLTAFGVNPASAYTANDGAKTILTDGSYSDTVAAETYVDNKNEDGWVITIGNAGGAYSWASALTINIDHNVTIQGASSISRPTITMTHNSNAGITIANTPGKTITVKDMILRSTGTNEKLITISGGGTSPNVFRISNVRFNDRSQRAIWVYASYGLIDNCYFDGNNAGISSIEIQPRPAGAGWTGNMEFGTTSTVTIEDCVFSLTSSSPYIQQSMDSDRGGRYIFRYNNLTNFNIATHGDDSSGINNSVLHGEIYKNNFWFSPPRLPDFMMILRGGSHVVFSNTVSHSGNDSANHMVKQWYLRGNSSGGDGQAGGELKNSYPADYPGHQQVGRGVTGGVSGQPFPTYYWNNKWDSVGYNLITEGYDSSDGRFIVDGRDYYSNTPKPNYTPLVYPHPLRSASPPAQVPPSITGNPQSLTLTEGQSATFTVSAGGSTPLAYQWQRNLSNIPGATSSTYSIASVQTNAAGSFRCVISNAYGSVTSAAATLTVNVPVPTPAAITTNPQSLTRLVGQSAVFTVTATGSTPLVYQWQKNLSNISGATAPSYSIASVQTNDTGSFRCVVSNALGAATSSVATLTVSAAAGGNLRYVDQTAGNDANAGTANSPWLRCPGMVGWTGSATLQPGDIVYFDRSDTWDMGQNSGGPGLELRAGVHYIGDEWDPEAVGTGRAILRATGRHAAGVVRIWEDHATLPTWIEGFEVDANGQRANLIDINHAFWKTGLTKAVKRIEDCIAHGNSGNGSEGDYKYGIIVSDHSPDASGWVANVEILNTVVYNVARDGICLYPGDNGMISNVVVRGCEVYDTGNDPSYSEGHGLMFKANVKNSVFEYCYAHDVNSSAVFINGPESGSGTGPTGCVIRYCVLQTADNNGVIRFYGTGTKACDIYGNIVLENETTGGLSLSGNSGTITANIYNNTFFNAFVDLGNPGGSGTINFRNNIVYELDDVCLTDSGGDLDTHSHNLFYRANGGALVSAGGSTYNAGNISSWESTAQTADPLFKNTSNLPDGYSGNFGSDLAPNKDGLSPQAASPALNTGVTLGVAYSGAINSAARPVGAAWDRGAYEGLGGGQPLVAIPQGLRVIPPTQP